MPPGGVIPVQIKPEEVEEALTYIFEEYNQAKDGNLTRKEFFTFLWELKQTAKQSLNEGQMMSCWLAVSRKQESVGFDDFKDGLELCYENQFFAHENGAEPPRLVMDDVDPSSYNTIKFKQSQGVAAFNKILEDEKETSKDRSVRPMTMYGGQHKTGGAASAPYVPRPAAARATGDQPVRERPPVAPRPDKDAIGPINNFAMKMNMLQKERDVKKVEAQKKMDEILAARYQAQKKEREVQRQQIEEERSRQRAAEADALVAEPLWMQNLKNKKKF